MGNITGNVEDRSTGQSLERVMVSFPGTSTFTDSSGNYILTTFDKVSGPLEFSKSGFITQSVIIDAPFPEDPDLIRGASLIPLEEPPEPPVEKLPEPPKLAGRKLTPGEIKAVQDAEKAGLIIPQLANAYFERDMRNEVLESDISEINSLIEQLLKIPPLLDTETVEFWIKQDFPQQEAEAIAKWVKINLTEPTQETINQILIDAGLRAPPEEPSLLDVLKSFFIAENWVLAFQTFKQDFVDEITPDSPAEELMAELVLTLIPVGKVAKGSLEISKFFKVREWFNIGKKFSTKNINPLEIERYLAANKYTELLEYARTEPRLFAEFLAQTSPEVKSLVLKGLRAQADPTAFNMAVQAIHKVEGAKGLSIFRIPTLISEHKFATAALAVSGLGTAFGVDIWGNWAIIDNLAFTLLQESKAARDLFINNELTREEALAELDRLISLSELGRDKVEVSSKLNPIQFLFFPLLDEIAEENTKLLKIVRSNIERAAAPLPKGRLIINPTPTDAKVSVEGQIPSTGVFNKELDIGDYNYTVSKFGFTSLSQVATIRENEETSISINLDEIPEDEIVPPIPPEEVTGKLIISVIPEDAIITVAGHEEITGPGEYIIRTGSKGVKAEKEGFVSQTKNVFVRSDIDVAVSFILKEVEPVEPPEPIPPKEATITFTSNPTGADVYINGKYTFTKTPYTTLLEAGNYILRVQKDGFFPNEIQAEIMEGEVATLNFDLQGIPTEQFIPGEFVPFTPTYPSGFETLFPVVQAQRPLELLPARVEKELLVNIETTDAKPWKGRIFSIAFQDLSKLDSTPTVMVNENEEELLRQFIEMFNVNEFKRLIGFKLTFDHRYIFNKLMLYRMQSEKWADIDLRDVKQLLDQVKEEFVYFPDKTGTLNDYGKSLLGKGKYGPQKTLLKMFLAQNFGYVEAFQNQQIEITKDLYDLFRFSASESLPAASLGTSHTIPSQDFHINQAPSMSPGEKKCRKCLQVNPFDATECLVCGDKL